MNGIYCGPPPTPASLIGAWNPDPYAAALCLALAALLFSPGTSRQRMVAAIALIAILFVSPLCALTAALFSARVLHHVLLVAVAAPLLAAALPVRRLLCAVPVGVLVVLHAATIWVWHAPAIYTPAVSSVPLYWLMQLGLLGTGVILWQRIFSEGTGIAAFLAIFATATQMGLLGALLTFIRAPLYAPHLLTTEAFGLSPLADQQLAGLIMWVPAAIPYLAIALFLFVFPRRPVERRAA